MNKEELIGKLQMVYIGDKNALNEMIYYYDELFDEMESWKQDTQKYKEVIEKAIDLIESKNNGVCVINGKEKEAFTFLLDFDKAREFIWKLLEILKEVE